MKQLILKRIAQTENETFGVLIDNNVPFAVTLEQPWKNNKPFESCIPEGEYICKRVDSPKFGITFEITFVKNRTDILFHKGNTVKDTSGCILVAEQFGEFEKNKAILWSKKGFDEFMKKLVGINSFGLKIKK